MSVVDSWTRHQWISDINAYQFSNISFQNVMLAFLAKNLKKKNRKNKNEARQASVRWGCKMRGWGGLNDCQLPPQPPPKRKHVDVCRPEILLRFFKWQRNFVDIVFVCILLNIIVFSSIAFLFFSLFFRLRFISFSSPFSPCDRCPK